MNIYQSNIYRKDLSWENFDMPWAQEMQQVKDQQSYIPVFVAYLIITSNRKEHQPKHDISIPCKTVL